MANHPAFKEHEKPLGEMYVWLGKQLAEIRPFDLVPTQREWKVAIYQFVERKLLPKGFPIEFPECCPNCEGPWQPGDLDCRKCAWPYNHIPEVEEVPGKPDSE